MNKAEQLILKMEVEEFLKETSKQIVIDMQKHFPTIQGLNVVINVWITPFKNDHSHSP